MKKLFTLLLLASCSKTPNPAEVMIKAQVPEAKCVDYGTKDGISIVRCTIKGDKDSVTIVGAYSVAHPFQSWALYTGEQLKKQNTPAPAPTPAPTPDAGVPEAGEGSGSRADAK